MKLPEFIRLKGCINCESSKSHKERTGRDYGFDHELMLRCLLSDCFSEGVDLANPFIDPREVVEKFKEMNNPDYKEKVKKYIRDIKERFGKYYEEIDVS